MTTTSKTTETTTQKRARLDAILNGLPTMVVEMKLQMANRTAAIRLGR